MSAATASFDVVVVGAGPAGIAAASTAADSVKRVLILDDNGSPGGQIWRGGQSAERLAQRWLAALGGTNIEVRSGARVVAADPAARLLTVESEDDSSNVGFQALVLATGARERFLPFPGWTLPNVMGAGALQAFAKSGLDVRKKRVIVAGTGPLLLAVAAYLKHRGADIRLIAEQASREKLISFAAALSRRPKKAWQALHLRSALWNVPYRTSTWVNSATGTAAVTEVELESGSPLTKEPCDFLAIGYGLIPNTELASTLGCRVSQGSVTVDDRQATTVPHVFCAGEATGIGGVDLAIAEGIIAGYAASENRPPAQTFFRLRDREHAFALALADTFSLNEKLKNLPAADTIVCRCEDVTYARLRGMSGWRSAKLETRCGMGPCQGRICGTATEFLFGWHMESVRPPISPARIETLIESLEVQN